MHESLQLYASRGNKMERIGRVAAQLFTATDDAITLQGVLACSS